jgi:hypothetical protein
MVKIRKVDLNQLFFGKKSCDQTTLINNRKQNFRHITISTKQAIGMPDIFLIANFTGN